MCSEILQRDIFLPKVGGGRSEQRQYLNSNLNKRAELPEQEMSERAFGVAVRTLPARHRESGEGLAG